MDPTDIDALKAKLAVLKAMVLNVGTFGQNLRDNETRNAYRALYKDIEKTVNDPNLSTYVPQISDSISSGFSSALWAEHQLEIVDSGTKLIAYLQAILESAPSPINQLSEKTRPRASIFLSHGIESMALQLTHDYVEALGLTPVVVKSQPSRGMSLDTKVETYLRTCRAAIILATGDDKVEKSQSFQPRQNVIHEIGLAQQLLGNNITYLLEQNTEFPSNIAPKVYARFTKDNLTNAFIAIASDLRAFGLL